MKIILSYTFIILSFCAAEAHVTIDPKTGSTGSYAKLTFRVPHGCEGSSTTKISVQLPEGVLSVKPQVHFGWDVSVKKTKLKSPAMLHGKEVTETVSEITWKGGPLSDDYMDEFGVSLKLPENSSDPKLVFPVIQECEKGINRWVEVAKTEEEAHKKRFPAPFIILEKENGHHH